DRVKTIFARFQFADHFDLSMLMWRMRHGDFTARRHDVGEQLLCQTAGRRHGASSTLADRGSTAIGKSCKLVHWCRPCAENFSRRGSAAIRHWRGARITWPPAGGLVAACVAPPASTQRDGLAQF